MKPCRISIAFFALILAAGPLSAGAVRADEGRCEIQGPTTVTPGEAFTLCGPTGRNLNYRWQGQGVVGSSQNRCLNVSGLRSGVYDFTLTTTRRRENDDDALGRDRGDETQRCTVRVRVLSENDRECAITGPSTVDAFTSFQLCTPEVEDATYRWSGTGVPTSSNRRCVTINGLAPGHYTFSLRVDRDGQRRDCTLDVRVRESSSSCFIEGPSTVATDSSFRLCGPSGWGLDWSWSGPSISGDDDERCVTVSGLIEGTYTYTLRVTRDGTTRTCTFVVRALHRDRLPCLITGPSVVREDQAFTLCGPDDPELDFTWEGPGVTGQQDEQRCVTISGLSPGRYLYTLNVNGPDVDENCTFTVNVRASGEALGACPRTIDFWNRQCDGTDDRRRIVLEQEDLRQLAACVDDRTDAFDWSRDLASFCSLVDASSKNRRTWVRQQFASLLANVCAWEHGLTDRNGDPIGIDPSSRLSCRALNAETVNELLPRIEDLLDRSADRERIDREAWRELRPLARCLERINRGRGLEGSPCGGEDDDDERDDDSVREAGLAEEPMPTAAELARDPDEVALDRLAPNPFSAWTRMQYSVSRDGEAVELGVYDIAGRMVQRLETGPKNAGMHEVRWNGTDQAGSSVRPGVYFVRGSIGSRPLNLRVMYLR